MARVYGERVIYDASRTGNSGHYYIDRDGSVHRFVADTRIAHHVHGYNTRSIGIEMVNLGRYPNWLDSRHQTMSEPYPGPQIGALLALLKWLKQHYPKITEIAGHEDLDLGLVPSSDNPHIQLPRKRDPGPLFPWNQIVPACGLHRLTPAL
jgi:N-acetylmuramoyl-L-alanine amidase